MYIIEPDILQEIPEKTYFNITDVINQIIKRKGRVGCFAVTEKVWTDIGSWESYLKIIKQ